eukprot:symbB.v1.2.009503.t1/scaffold590.1/size183855/15
MMIHDVTGDVTQCHWCPGVPLCRLGDCGWAGNCFRVDATDLLWRAQVRHASEDAPDIGMQTISNQRCWRADPELSSSIQHSLCMDDIRPDEAAWQCPVCNHKLHDTEDCARGWLRLRQSCPTCRSAAWAPPPEAVTSFARVGRTRRLPRAFSADAAPFSAPQSPSLPEISVAGMNMLRPAVSAVEVDREIHSEPRAARPEVTPSIPPPPPTRPGVRARSLPPREGLALAGLAIGLVPRRHRVPKKQTEQPGGQNEEVKWPNGYYSPSTSEWESWHVGSDQGDTQGNRVPVIDLKADGEPLHVEAGQEDGESWWADGGPEKEYAESQGVSPLVVGGLCLLGCCVPIVCFFARRSPRKETGPHEGRGRSGWAIGHGFDESLDDEEKGRRNLSKFSARTWNSQFSEETTDTGGSSPSGSFGLNSKEPKVYPEPDQPDLEEFRASRGDWRLPRSHSAQPPPMSRPDARDWQVPNAPSDSWYQKQEEERQRRQREKEDLRKSHKEQTKAEQEAWQKDWIKNKREQDKVEKERKRHDEEEAKRQQQQKEAAQKQQEEAEKQRKRQQEDVWKKKEEELRRKAQQEADAERAQRAERERQQDEQRKQQEAKRREKEAQQRHAEQQREARQKQAKQQRKKPRGGFFGRWGGRARSEPPKETRTRTDAGHQWTQWPGASPQPETREDKARKAKEHAERMAKERQQEAAEKKASSLMDSVMKQIDNTRSAPLEERKKVFKELQRQLHPDKNPQEQEAAKLAFQKLMENRNVYLA